MLAKVRSQLSFFLMLVASAAFMARGHSDGQAIDGEGLSANGQCGAHGGGAGPSSSCDTSSPAVGTEEGRHEVKCKDRATARTNKGAVLLVPHGGGPMPLLGDPDHAPLISWLQGYPQRLTERRRQQQLAEAAEVGETAGCGTDAATAEGLEKKKVEAAAADGGFSAIIVFSAHWEERVATITAGPRPKLIYDYSGFPSESYSIRYDAPGSPQLARRIASLFSAANITHRLDERRGWDHGVFVPLKLMFPKADIPIVQVSLVRGLDPALHIAMGKALRELVETENVLVLGSGFTFHNMGAFFGPERARKVQNEAFEAWLKETCAGDGLSASERERRLIAWEKAPHARFCHPREEHLIPLHVCFGAAGGAAAEVAFDGNVLAKTTGYLWF